MKHHHSTIFVLIVIVHFRLPDRDPRGFYEDAPSKTYFGEDVAIPPSDHTYGCDCPQYHEEQEANNDRQRCQAVRESLQPEAQHLPYIVPKMSNFMMTECHGLCV